MARRQISGASHIQRTILAGVDHARSSRSTRTAREQWSTGEAASCWRPSGTFASILASAAASPEVPYQPCPRH
eukprot:2651204-Pyramimonas_sp.AAC.1